MHLWALDAKFCTVMHCRWNVILCKSLSIWYPIHYDIVNILDSVVDIKC